MKKLAPAAVIGGLIVTGPAGPANPQTSPNPQRPERVRPSDVRDQNGDSRYLRDHGGARDLAGASGGGEENGQPDHRRRADADGNCIGSESPWFFLTAVVRLTATVNVG